MANLSRQQIIEDLVSTMSAISQSVVDSAQSFDSTIKCTIIAKTDKGYRVSYNSVQFEVFTLSYDDAEYKVGDVVYVTVPQKDFSQEKYIVHKDFTEEDISYSFDPEDDLYPNSIQDFKPITGRIAKGPIEKLILVYNTADCRKKESPLTYPDDFGFNITLDEIGVNTSKYQEKIEVRPKDMSGMIYYNPYYTQNKFVMDVTAFRKLKVSDIRVVNPNKDIVISNDYKLIGGLAKSLHEATNAVDIYSFDRKVYNSLDNYRKVKARFFYTNDDDGPVVTYSPSDILEDYIIEWYHYSESEETESPSYIPKNWRRIGGSSFTQSWNCDSSADRDGLLCCVRSRAKDVSGQPEKVFYDYIMFSKDEAKTLENLAAEQTEEKDYFKEVNDTSGND